MKPYFPSPLLISLLAITSLLASCGAPTSTSVDTELPAFTSRAAGDYKRLQGSWVVTSNEIRKQALPQMAGAVFYFEGNLHWIAGDQAPEWFALDESTSPKSIDIYDRKTPTIRGIYKIEGSQLTLCTAAPGYPRPAGFETSPSTGTILTTTRRQ